MIQLNKIINKPPLNITPNGSNNIKDHKEKREKNEKERRGEEDEEISYLAKEAYIKLGDEKTDPNWILTCYRKNKKLAETALGITLDTAKHSKIRSKGALFTYIFKQIMKNK